MMEKAHSLFQLLRYNSEYVISNIPAKDVLPFVSVGVSHRSESAVDHAASALIMGL